jgi:hypothetical protein
LSDLARGAVKKAAPELLVVTRESRGLAITPP